MRWLLLGKYLGERPVDIAGEKITYRVTRNGRIKGRGYSHWGEGTYLDEPFKVDDHGHGLEHLDDLVKGECLTIRKKKSKNQHWAALH